MQRLGNLAPGTRFLFERHIWHVRRTGKVLSHGYTSDGFTPCVMVKLDPIVENGYDGPSPWNPDIYVEVLP